MSLAIWKFPFGVDDEVVISAPSIFRPLCVQVQGDQTCLWAVVDTESAEVRHRVLVRGTGHLMGAAGTAHYVGTFQLMGGRLVFHVFTEAEPWKP